MKERLAIGIDLGGTAVKAGLIDEKLHIVDQRVCPTEACKGFEHVLGTLAGLVADLAGDGQSIVGVGVGSPGPLSPSRGVIFKSVNLPGWTDVPLRDLLADRTGLSVVLENDANAAAYGEFRARHASDDLILITLGTGVGAGTVIGGRVFHGHFENGSEWGHLIVQPGGRSCKCGQIGCLESYASATAVVESVTTAMAAGETCSLSGQSLSITADVVAEAARSGDALCLRVWEDACRMLAVACVGMQHAVNPRHILIGGGMSAAGAILLDAVRRHQKALTWQLHADAPLIGLARLGNKAGIIGAAALAFEEFGP